MAAVVTAYRQRTLACAAVLRDEARPVSDLAAEVLGAGRILLRNVYGWFARERRGVYRLTGSGEQADSECDPARGRPAR